jgi:hypothetical protein
MLRTNSSQTSNMAILISSCDKYSDLWLPYFFQFNKHWPDCPYNIYLISETKTIPIENVKFINVGFGLSWTESLNKALESITEEIILFTLEDFILKSDVDTSKITELQQCFENNSMNMLRLVARPGPDIYLNEIYGQIKDFAKYKVSTQAAIWRKKILKEITAEAESIWSFEINGSQRYAKLNKFYAVNRDVYTYHHHAVEKGKWFPWDAYIFLKNGAPIDLKLRPIMSMPQTTTWILKKIISILFEYIKKVKQK